MNAVRDTREMIASMSPVLLPGQYVYVVVDPADGADWQPLATVHEPEGLSLVVPREQADLRGREYDFVAAWITLRVHSALDGVGLTAAVAGALARTGISCNVIAGYHHDHLLVPAARGSEAVAVLTALADAARAG